MGGLNDDGRPVRFRFITYMGGARLPFPVALTIKEARELIRNLERAIAEASKGKAEGNP